MKKRTLKFLHDYLAWHFPDDSRGFDGCSVESHCKLCGRLILQDSQGNWFTVGRA